MTHAAVPESDVRTRVTRGFTTLEHARALLGEGSKEVSKVLHEIVEMISTDTFPLMQAANGREKAVQVPGIILHVTVESNSQAFVLRPDGGLVHVPCRLAQVPDENEPRWLPTANDDQSGVADGEEVGAMALVNMASMALGHLQAILMMPPRKRRSAFLRNFGC